MITCTAAFGSNMRCSVSCGRDAPDKINRGG